ncbi:MAG: PadR family transcriptional regulator [Bacteroidota bacterium]
MDKLSKELVGASSIPIILSVLSEQESYGYEIIQKVKELSDGQITYADGTLYPVLHKLEKKKLIESYWKVSESGRKRKYYSISDTGKTVLDTKKQNWILMNQIITKL